MSGGEVDGEGQEGSDNNDAPPRNAQVGGPWQDSTTGDLKNPGLNAYDQAAAVHGQVPGDNADADLYDNLEDSEEEDTPPDPPQRNTTHHGSRRVRFNGNEGVDGGGSGHVVYAPHGGSRLSVLRTPMTDDGYAGTFVPPAVQTEAEIRQAITRLLETLLAKRSFHESIAEQLSQLIAAYQPNPLVSLLLGSMAQTGTSVFLKIAPFLLAVASIKHERFDTFVGQSSIPAFPRTNATGFDETVTQFVGPSDRSTWLFVMMFSNAIVAVEGLRIIANLFERKADAVGRGWATLSSYLQSFILFLVIWTLQLLGDKNFEEVFDERTNWRTYFAWVAGLSLSGPFFSNVFAGWAPPKNADLIDAAVEAGIFTILGSVILYFGRQENSEQELYLEYNATEGAVPYASVPKEVTLAKQLDFAIWSFGILAALFIPGTFAWRCYAKWKGLKPNPLYAKETFDGELLDPTKHLLTQEAGDYATQLDQYKKIGLSDYQHVLARKILAQVGFNKKMVKYHEGKYTWGETLTARCVVTLVPPTLLFALLYFLVANNLPTKMEFEFSEECRANNGTVLCSPYISQPNHDVQQLVGIVALALMGMCWLKLLSKWTYRLLQQDESEGAWSKGKVCAIITCIGTGMGALMALLTQALPTVSPDELPLSVPVGAITGVIVGALTAMLALTFHISAVKPDLYRVLGIVSCAAIVTAMLILRGETFPHSNARLTERCPYEICTEEDLERSVTVDESRYLVEIMHSYLISFASACGLAILAFLSENTGQKCIKTVNKVEYSSSYINPLWTMTLGRGDNGVEERVTHTGEYADIDGEGDGSLVPKPATPMYASIKGKTKQQRRDSAAYDEVEEGDLPDGEAAYHLARQETRHPYDRPADLKGAESLRYLDLAIQPAPVHYDEASKGGQNAGVHHDYNNAVPGTFVTPARNVLEGNGQQGGVDLPPVDYRSDGSGVESDGW